MFKIILFSLIISFLLYLVTCSKNMEKNYMMSTTEATKTASTALVDNSKESVENSKALVENSKSLIESKSLDDNGDDFDIMAVMTMCNESFRIEMAFLVSLNETGSFPDELDKTPKCYLRCVLENLQIESVEDGKLDPERAAVIFAGERNGEPMEDIQEMTTYCAQRGEKCRCEKAYNFLKCLFSMEIEKYSKPKA